MTITESRVVLVRSEQVVARFDGADGFRNFQASVKWARARGYGPGDVICGPGGSRDVGAELVAITQVYAGEVMTDEQIALARRAVACKGWRWMPGMHRVDDMLPHRRFLCRSGGVGRGWVPDLTDPATLGCLLALVRGAWGDRYASVWCDTQFSTWEDRWVYSADGTTKTGFSTEAEALVYALEAAP